MEAAGPWEQRGLKWSWWLWLAFDANDSTKSRLWQRRIANDNALVRRKSRFSVIAHYPLFIFVHIPSFEQNIFCLFNCSWHLRAKHVQTLIEWYKTSQPFHWKFGQQKKMMLGLFLLSFVQTILDCYCPPCQPKIALFYIWNAVTNKWLYQKTYWNSFSE